MKMDNIIKTDISKTGLSGQSRTQAVETVGDIVADRPPLTFSPGTPIERIVQHMHRRDRGAVIITDASGRLIGILTERDILRKIFGVYNETKAERSDRRRDVRDLGRDMTAWDVLVPNPDYLDAAMDLEAALEKIRACGHRYMPVMKGGRHGPFAGIVSERELFWHAQDKIRREMTQKDTLLSYFMHHEPYGTGAVERRSGL